MKKMKEKYGDQDDEEKEERMALLQVRWNHICSNIYEKKKNN